MVVCFDSPDVLSNPHSKWKFCDFSFALKVVNKNLVLVEVDGDILMPCFSLDLIINALFH